MPKLLTLVFCVLMVLDLSSQSGTTNKSEYYYGFETPLTNPPWAVEGGPNKAKIVDDPTEEGSNKVLKAELRLPDSNQVWNNGSTRSEIRWQKGADGVPNWAPDGSNYSYRFRMYVPQDHVCDPIDPEIVCQWHQPNGFNINSPPLSIRIQRCNIKLRYITSEVYKGQNKSAIRKTISSDVGFIKGSWHYFVVDIRWDYRQANGAGFVKVYMSNEGWPDSDNLIINYEGPIGQNNGIGSNFKLGVYKWRWKHTEDVEQARAAVPPILERVYYYDDVTIKKGHTFP